MGAALRNPKFWVFGICLLPLVRLIVLGISGGLVMRLPWGVALLQTARNRFVRGRD